ncbi:hypothetical protein BXZ70DRAFT_930001 [Cristinia sonorae]|uniref:BTB domain-containing protein n=1 Tax=Cristinia sonorae TaxID=1940300 RepID=A0A8K0UQW4_9AGAR|nr:hypothetical protein BXZ70DRAFT_930001 [Cristinia sonorae]
MFSAFQDASLRPLPKLVRTCVPSLPPMSETTSDTLTAAPSPPTAPVISHDVEYYFDDSLVTLQVESVLFKVHRYFFTRDSEFFKGLFSLPQPPNTSEGQTDDSPIKLEGVKVKEFKCLLRFFYTSMYGPTITTLSDWMALLSISTRYVFDRIRDMAIQELSTKGLDPIKKITLANQYSIPQWLPPAYVDLCKRPEPLTEVEACSLGLPTVVRVAKAREIAREKRYIVATQRSYFPHDKIYNFNDSGILEVVQGVWPECVIPSPEAARPSPVFSLP